MHILIVDDHRLFAEGLTVLLKELQPNVQVTSVNSIAQAKECHYVFDLILLDLHMPDAIGFDGLTRLKAAHEASPIVVVSGEESATQIRDCIHLGAMGFVPKSSSAVELFAALKRILAGEPYLPSHIIHTPTESMRTEEIRLKLNLTKRQLEVLTKVVQGKPNKIIARELKISDTTVKSHVLAVLMALDVHNRTEAVYKAAALGMSFKTFSS
jgi:DNA-binding NarL/FixJ family response regulator